MNCKITSLLFLSSSRTWNGFFYDPLLLQYPGNRAQYDNVHPEGLSHDHRGSVLSNVPGVYVLRPGYMRSLQSYWSNEPLQLSAGQNSVSWEWWYIPGYKRHGAADTGQAPLTCFLL